MFVTLMFSIPICPEGMTAKESSILEEIINDKFKGELVKASFHHHTKYSNEWLNRNATVEFVLREAFKNDIGLLVVTDKSNDQFFDKLKEPLRGYVIDEDDNRVIRVTDKGSGKSLYIPRAMEFHHKKGHMLLIGYNKKISNLEGLDLFNLADEVHNQGGIVIPAHPYATFSGGVGEYNLLQMLTRIDAVEVYNSQLTGPLNRFNEKAKKFAKEKNLSRICSNDAQLPVDSIGKTYMMFPKELINTNNAQDYINSIKRILYLTKNLSFYNKIAHETPERMTDLIKWEALLMYGKALEKLKIATNK